MTIVPDSLPVGPFRARPGVIATDLESELILLDPDTQEMYGLDETGRAVWRALPAPDVATLAEVLCVSFQVSAERARADVESFLTEMVEAGLVEVEGSDGAD